MAEEETTLTDLQIETAAIAAGAIEATKEVAIETELDLKAAIRTLTTWVERSEREREPEAEAGLKTVNKDSNVLVTRAGVEVGTRRRLETSQVMVEVEDKPIRNQ